MFDLKIFNKLLLYAKHHFNLWIIVHQPWKRQRCYALLFVDLSKSTQPYIYFVFFLLVEEKDIESIEKTFRTQENGRSILSRKFPK